MTRLERLSEEDRARNYAVYDLLERAGFPDGWRDEQKFENFRKLAKIEKLAKIPLKGSACLDVGCGTGDLSFFLRERGVSSYLGIDIYQPALDDAQRKYPTEDFRNIDILSETVVDKFDYVFCSGALSVRLKSDNYAFIEGAISKMIDMARAGVAFNLLVDEYGASDRDLFYYSLSRIIAICRNNPRIETVTRAIDPAKSEAHLLVVLKPH